MADTIERLENGKIRLRTPQPDKIQDLSVEELQQKKITLVTNIGDFEGRISSFQEKVAGFRNELASVEATLDLIAATSGVFEEVDVVEKEE